jgi:hypothetical protein
LTEAWADDRRGSKEAAAGPPGAAPAYEQQGNQHPTHSGRQACGGMDTLPHNGAVITL